MDNMDHSNVKKGEVGLGEIPQAIIPPLPSTASPVKEEVPEPTPDAANPIVGSTEDTDIMSDPEPAEELELPTQTVNDTVEVDGPTVETAADVKPVVGAEGSEQVEPESAEVVGSIWDECELHPDASEHLTELFPVFGREDAPEGADIALSPTTAVNLAALAQAKELFTQDDLIWMLNAQQAAMVAPTDNIGLRRLMREGSHWTQRIPAVDPKGDKISISMLPSKAKRPKGPGEEVSGSDALERFMAGTTMGGTVTVPLTNTGIWVRLSPAGASFLAELDRNLAYARMQVGLDTNGITGSTDDLIFREIINEAALRLITATNYPVKDPMDLREVIDDEDHKTLSWALAKVLYPKGIMVSIPCIDPKCGHVDTFRANPARMHLIDRSKLNAKQLQYLARGITRPMTMDEIEDYKAQFVKTAKYSKRIMNREFLFRSPTISEKLQIGRSWLSSVNQAVDSAMASTPDDDMKRNNIIQQITAIEQVCRYAHYISEIRIYDEDDEMSENYFTITGESEIRTILKALSTEPEITEELIEAIEEFLVEIGTTLIGYPNASCSKCNHENVPDKVKNRLILPFDPDTGFFILAQRKILQAGGNPLTDLTTFGVANLAARAQGSAPMVSFDPS